MRTLHETLSSHTVQDLKSRLNLLQIKAGSPRKADLIKAIEEALYGKPLEDVWHSLSRLEQVAVAETCYSPDLTLHEAQFAAKYGRRSPLCARDEDCPSSHFRSRNSGDPGRVTILLYQLSYHSPCFIPDDLAGSLRAFVPRPDPLTVKSLPGQPDEAGMQVRSTEQEALRDVAALMRLAERGGLRATAKTGMPTAAGKKAILECLIGGDFFPPETAFPANRKSWQQEIGAIKLVGWVRLLQVGGYLTSGGTRSDLTQAGVKALSKARHESIRHLWNKWVANNEFDEFNRIEAVKGQKAKGHMTAKPPRREAIVRALCQCPVNEWIDTRSFSSFMQAERFDFTISHDRWKLYVADAQYGSFGYAGYGGWNILQFRYLLALLFEYAATLGLVDIAFVHPEGALSDFRKQWGADDLEWLSRYDGLRAFRVTNLGAYCLGMTESYEETHPETSLRLELSSDLSIRLLSATIQPADTLLLDTWAEPLEEGIWRLDPLRARDAVERGNSVDDFLSFLEGCDEQLVPETIQGFFKTCQSNGQALRNAGEARLFDCRDSQTADLLFEQENLKALCRRCGETQLVVPEKHIPKFQKHVRSLGLGFA